ncbi:zinc-binding dehydrogenase [Yinghuangia sp. ASG 101]|uniref:zinc-binding dehydrogenase n=1 Tax=Yinghuangia sp. ASG 101 TaxID=2896848 RepID=UPI001E3080A8|nr:zinc-binding dehydrogenase [Yinghuangia sp. ASG 101]UGQ12373.1 zinc-binding dehydrogenase [Yinghuangia sp. ASG 101]
MESGWGMVAVSSSWAAVTHHGLRRLTHRSAAAVGGATDLRGRSTDGVLRAHCASSVDGTPDRRPTDPNATARRRSRIGRRPSRNAALHCSIAAASSPWTAERVLASRRGERFSGFESVGAFREWAGANEFVDLENDALEDVGGVDLVFDVIGGDIQRRSAALVRPGGTLVTVVAPPEARPVDGRAIDFVVEADRAQLTEIVRRVRDGRLRTNIGDIAGLDEALAALNPTLRRNGKTIVRVRP